MPYTDSSGVQIPVGTDAFNPTPQFKTWQDKNATYNNRVIVPLDTDRTALAAPVLRDGLECYVEATQILWLYDAGWHVIGGVRNIQLDTTNSTAFLAGQWGIGRIVGSGTNTVNETVTFPVAFTAVPFVQVMGIGIKSPTGGAYNPAGTLAAGYAIPSAYNLTATSFIANLTTYTGTFGASADFYYSWQATGTLA